RDFHVTGVQTCALPIFAHSGLDLTRIVEFTFSTQEALFGVVAATFATFVFPFMIFGAFLEASGAGQFFMELGTAVAGRWRGGPRSEERRGGERGWAGEE